MNNLPNIFISYNSNSEFEETLAIRLHTIAAVHGFNVYLPDRHFNSVSMSQETQARINISNYYILFSTTAQLSKVALEEIQYAYKILKDKSKIIIIYDVAQGKNMKGTDGCTELYYNRKTQTPESFIANVMRRIQNQHAALTRVAKQNDEALAGLILAGLGLLLLGALTTSKK